MNSDIDEDCLGGDIKMRDKEYSNTSTSLNNKINFDKNNKPNE